MDDKYKTLLSAQGYVMAGEHTAVKTCEWTRKGLKGEGTCYKHKFYGINSHQCVQMSPAVNTCAMDCVYCWRDRHESAFGKRIDDPEHIIEHCIAAQRRLLIGFKGNVGVTKEKFAQSMLPKHFAISLTGEPTAYPYLHQLIDGLKDRGITSFLVTNGQFPEMVAKVNPTQLYVSFDTPDEQLFYKLDRPDLKDAWERLHRTLDIIKPKKYTSRTVLRLTLLKGVNDNNHEGFAEIFEKADPLCIEVKGYMFVGASRERLDIKQMPRHEDIIQFCKEIEKHSPYRIVDDQLASRVVLMMKPEDLPYRFIDTSGYDKRHEAWAAKVAQESPDVIEGKNLPLSIG
ncbi:4-demethylwyosine synthase TYW1 [Candidatus Woesearchaeota archaeon]|nr:4-demethylwyosine synthase TYW1 [Candidatus Woesearchaeota archaeon]